VRVEITRIAVLPSGLDALVAEAMAEGFAALERMRRAWRDGSNRFDRDGEALWTATRAGRLAGICGLNRDPYLETGGVARLRHLYVAREARRLGIGRALVDAALAHARGRFHWMRLRTHARDARAFYAALGFDAPPPALAADATHAWPLDAR